MTKNEAFYSIALTITPKVGTVGAKRLIDMAGSATFIFEHVRELAAQKLIHPSIANQLQQNSVLEKAQRIYDETLSKGIAIIPFVSDLYPPRLKECEDAPIILFYKGSANLDESRVISIVGTRNMTEYGRDVCNRLVSDLAAYDKDILIVSGLAYGADVQAHRSALDRGLNTVGVLAHGLDIIYPSAHYSIAEEMCKNGGLLTEFCLHTEPERYNFVSRNRIVAGISDATIVIESAAKGGSLITADLANDYNRECFALPGRVTDKYSAGCNYLIRKNKAVSFSSAEDIIDYMGWGQSKKHKTQKTRNILDENITLNEKNVIELLQSKGDLQIDHLVVLTGIPISTLHTTLFELEMKGCIKSIVGGAYHLI